MKIVKILRSATS